MIIAKFNKNIKLCEVDDFVTKLKNKAKKKNIASNVMSIYKKTIYALLAVEMKLLKYSETQ